MKKPNLKGMTPPDRAEMGAIKENIEIITGRRGAKCDLDGLLHMTVSNPPTQAEMEFLRSQLYNLVLRLEE